MRALDQSAYLSGNLLRRNLDPHAYGLCGLCSFGTSYSIRALQLLDTRRISQCAEDLHCVGEKAGRRQPRPLGRLAYERLSDLAPSRTRALRFANRTPKCFLRLPKLLLQEHARIGAVSVSDLANLACKRAQSLITHDTALQARNELRELHNPSRFVLRLQRRGVDVEGSIRSLCEQCPIAQTARNHDCIHQA